MKKLYRFSPTLLNDFSHYVKGTGEENGQAWVDEQKLIDRLNGVFVTPSTAMSKGNLFEHAVTYGVEDEPIDNMIVLGYVENEPIICNHDVYRIAHKLFSKGTIQQYVTRTFEFPDYNITLHGYVDHIYGGNVTDIKTGSKLEYMEYRDTYQHSVYMIALQGMGVKVNQFQYFKTDFNDYSIETYRLGVDDFARVYDVCHDLVKFIEMRLPVLNKDRTQNGYQST